jgi:hypothetical protein
VAKGTRGKDIQVETTLGAMLDALNGDALLRAEVKDMTRLMDRALLVAARTAGRHPGPGPDGVPPGDHGASEPQGRALHGAALRAAGGALRRDRRSRPM